MKQLKTTPKDSAVINKDYVKSSFSLTVAESKRLIAKGIARHPLVKRKLSSGMVIITRGTTNTYIAEELCGLKEQHGKFVTGRIENREIKVEGETIAEIVLVDGKRAGMTFAEALKAMTSDDVVFKGANLLNYDDKQAAVTVVAEDGGTVGRIQPYTAEGPGHLIVPIGLEKEIYGDLYEYENILSQDIKKDGFVPKIAVHRNGEIFTEIEALKLFADVRIVPFAAGGVSGSEGAISLVVFGLQTEVDKVKDIISEVKGESAFVD
jgi:hypothetical protein